MMETVAQHKEALYRAYLNDAHKSGWVDRIARAIISGGYAIEEPMYGEGDPANRERVEYLLTQTDNDFLQLVCALLTDLLTYGEAYMEIISKGGKPFSLHRLDCITTAYALDEQQRRIVGYVQTLSHGDMLPFQPEEVVRWWLPDPTAPVQARSPLEFHTINWRQQFFHLDARFQFETGDSIKSLFFEKFNYRVLVKGMGITDWRVTCRYAA